MKPDIQSITDPGGVGAAKIADLWWFIFPVCTGVFLVTMALLAAALLRRPRSGEDPAPPLGANRFVLVSGIIVPALILTSFLFATLNTTVGIAEPQHEGEGNPLRIRVVGHQYWWEVHYPDHGLTIANELRIPAGKPVRLELDSDDVIHSFWVPRLNGKMDLVPGHMNSFWIAADQPGKYRGQCAEFCGVQHAKMAFWVVALAPDAFERWLAGSGEARAAPADPRLEKGRAAFFRAGCQECHTIAGTPAEGKRGPSLTRLGERLTLGAGTLPNTYGNLQGWIANPQAIKPGNLMPRMYVPARDLHTIAAYLESLK